MSQTVCYFLNAMRLIISNSKKMSRMHKSDVLHMLTIKRPPPMHISFFQVFLKCLSYDAWKSLKHVEILIF